MQITVRHFPKPDADTPTVERVANVLKGLRGESQERPVNPNAEIVLRLVNHHLEKNMLGEKSGLVKDSLHKVFAGVTTKGHIYILTDEYQMRIKVNPGKVPLFVDCVTGRYPNGLEGFIETEFNDKETIGFVPLTELSAKTLLENRSLDAKPGERAEKGFPVYLFAKRGSFEPNDMASDALKSS